MGLQLLKEYKIIVDTSRPVQGWTNTTEGPRYIQGYMSRLVQIIDIEERMLMERGGNTYGYVTRHHHRNDPYSFDLEFHVDIPSHVEGALPGSASVLIKDCQTIYMERWFRDHVFSFFVGKDNKLHYHYSHDFYYGSYLEGLKAKNIVGKVVDANAKSIRRWLAKR